MKLSPRQIVILLGAVAAIAVVWFFIATNLRKNSMPPEVQLTVWGTDDVPAVFEQVTQKYKAVRPNVTVSYERVGRAGYEEKLLNALASGQGPDIFVLPNRSLPKHIGKLVPADPSQISIAEIEELFPQIVGRDFIASSRVYALPLSIDTIALFYNKDMFDATGIVSPPKTWKEFQELVPALRVVNENRQIVRAAAAIGGTEKTVPHAADILHLLMLQSGVAMTTPDFSAAIFDSDKGVEAMNYYLQFGDAASSVYTWNENQPSAFDSFLAGKTAMVFGYLRDAEALKQKSPFFPLGIAAAPQAEGGAIVSYADYDGFAVSKQSKSSGWAWDFIAYAATDKGAASSYASAAKRVPVLRSLIAAAKTSPDLGVFARQALTARSWYEPDAERVEAVFNRALDRVIHGETDTLQALRQANDQVDQMMRALRKE